jgi:hypothetical protein
MKYGMCNNENEYYQSYTKIETTLICVEVEIQREREKKPSSLKQV